MARSSRPIGKPDAPGRNRRSRALSSPGGAVSPHTAPVVLDEASASPPRPRARLTFTKRALVLLVLVVMLTGSYLGSLRTLVMQSQQMNAAQRQIAERSVRVAELEAELQRWRDPDFVKAQARARLGWVMPGEVGYRVIGLDGQVLTAVPDGEGEGSPTTGVMRAPWWEELSGSIVVADRLAVEPEHKTEE